MTKPKFKMERVREAVSLLTAIETEVETQFSRNRSNSHDEDFQQRVANVIALYNAELQLEGLTDIATTNPMAA